MRSSYPIWEDFNSKATKLHSQLRTTVLAAVAFLDAFQKVADMATNTRGGTRDIGSALTRMCMRHRSIEAKLRQFTNALMESLINPLQDRIEDWKKTANQLDKDHNGELTMLGEITHLQGIIEDLVVLTAEPHKLPPASEQVIKDLKGSDYSWSYQTPPSSPSSSSSRKSSMCRYVGHGEEVSPAASDLAMVLTRGLSLEHQKSSRDSLQYSSGYSTQTTTPSCSEDTIPSQGSDYDCYSVNGDVECDPQSDFDKSSTIPRNSNIAQNYRRMIQTKRPASTAGLPTGTNLPTGTTPGVATIRRTPSTKPSVRRTLSNAGPLPIRP
ncbi:PREDICTED: MTSS1-like protein, partial [Charadrius vociferus]|uniref:MTSS1-like protein n=1 Tax=Charadrius vociferus TaxID=50402 RepID=UPI0005214796